MASSQTIGLTSQSFLHSIIKVKATNVQNVKFQKINHFLIESKIVENLWNKNKLKKG